MENKLQDNYKIDMSAEKASALAEKVLALDPSIIGVGMISNTGALLGKVAGRSELDSYSSDADDWGSRSFRAALMMGSVKANDRSLSTIESVILIRRKSKSLLIWLPQHAVILAVISKRTVNGTALSDKIRKFLGIE